jgi:hypothetical protein
LQIFFDTLFFELRCQSPETQADGLRQDEKQNNRRVFFNIFITATLPLTIRYSTAVEKLSVSDRPENIADRGTAILPAIKFCAVFLYAAIHKDVYRSSWSV